MNRKGHGGGDAGGAQSARGVHAASPSELNAADEWIVGVSRTRETKRRERPAALWSAATCRRFFRLADLSARQRRVERRGELSERSPCNFVGLTAFDGDKSPAESGDKLPHSKGCAVRRSSSLLLTLLFASLLFSGASFAQTAISPATTNQVLQLTGTNSYVRLPDNLLEGLTEITVEGWLKWERFRSYARFFDFGPPGSNLVVSQDRLSADLSFDAGGNNRASLLGREFLDEGAWHHVAAVCSTNGLRLFVNGLEVRDRGEVLIPNLLATIGRTGPNFLGRSVWNTDTPGEDEDFEGLMAEVRLWQTACTPEQVRSNLFATLTGREAGLLALWNFNAVENGVAQDLTAHGFGAKLMGRARVVAGQHPSRTEFKAEPVRSQVAGVIKSPSGRPLPFARFVLRAEGVAEAESIADESGRYVKVSRGRGQASLSVTHREGFTTVSNLTLVPGETLEVNLQLTPPAAVSGTVRATDGRPLPGVLLQLLPADSLLSPSDRERTARNPGGAGILAVALSHADGSYTFRSLPTGKRRVRAQGESPKSKVQSPRGDDFTWFQEGKPIELSSGSHVAGVDFVLEPDPPTIQAFNDSALHSPTNRVLVVGLDEHQGGYVELPPNIFNSLDESTVEAWVWWGGSSIFTPVYTYGDRSRSAIETIERSGDHLLAMINNILDLSKIEAGRMDLDATDFDLGELIHTLSAMMSLRCQQKQLEWVVESNLPKRLLVHGDDNKLRQVLINLTGNAVKFTQQGRVILRVTAMRSEDSTSNGPLTLTLSPSEGEREDHRPSSSKARITENGVRRTEQSPLPRRGGEGQGEGGSGRRISVRFEVLDTGPGIKRDKQAELFEPFHQGEAGRKFGGTGLGLAICRRQVELMGGSLQVDSTPGQGARFWFELALEPAESAVATGAQQASAEPRHLAAGHQVPALIVDDVPENRDVLGRLLESLGCTVQLTGSGEECLEVIEQRKPDIIFMDIRMPGIGGKEATRRIQRRLGPGATRIIAISASVFRHERNEYLAAGFDEFIGKPFRIQEVCGCMEKLLNVRFEYAASSNASDAAPDPAKLVLPSELLEQLRDAARRFSATRLETGLGELERAGFATLARYLRRLSDGGQLRSVSDFLARVNMGAPKK